MKYIYDHDFHIHSQISICSSDPKQTTERIWEYAKANNLSTICLTDHYWDENVKLISTAPGTFYKDQDTKRVSKAKPLPQKDGIRFLFGCEAEMDKNMTLGIAKERFDYFDFIVVPINHFHMTDFTIPAEMSSPKERAQFWLKKFNALLDMDLPFHKIGIAHLVCGLTAPSRAKLMQVINESSEADLMDVFSRAASKGVGIELNSDDMNYKDEDKDIILRPFRIAKKAGCKFYMGSDAHHPDTLDMAKDIFERAIDDLELEETDKFILKSN